MDIRTGSSGAGRALAVRAVCLAVAVTGSVLGAPAVGVPVTASRVGAHGPEAVTIVSPSGTVAGSSLAITWPQSQLALDQTSYATGSTSPAGREVELQELVGSTWSWVDSAQSDPASGSFSLVVPTDSAGTTTYRVVMYADGSDTVPDVVSSAYTVTVSDSSSTPTVTPTPTPTPEPGPEPSPDPTNLRSVRVEVSTSRTVVGGKVTMRGRVSGGAARVRVTLLQHLADGWHPVATRKTGNHAFTFKVPTGWYDTHELAVRADAYPGAAPVRSRTVAVSVVPSYRPGGRASSHAYIGAGRWRFNPCQVLEYRVNPARMPHGAMRDIKGALARLGQASGLRFRYVGTTKHVFDSARRPGPLTQGTDLYIAWASPRQVPGLRGSTAGLGGPHAWAGRDAKGPVWVHEYGNVVLDRTQPMKPGFGTGFTLGELLMHEVMHALGAGHVSDRTQIMNPVMTPGPARLGAGDLAFLHAVGMAGGCIDTRGLGFRTSAGADVGG